MSTPKRFEATVHCDENGTPFILETTNFQIIRHHAGGNIASCWGSSEECKGTATVALIHTDGGCAEGIYCFPCKRKRLEELAGGLS